MTRFARAEGSKASNKRTLQESTPWQNMKEQRKSFAGPEDEKSGGHFPSKEIAVKGGEILNCEAKCKKKKKMIPNLSGDVLSSLDEQNASLTFDNNEKTNRQKLTKKKRKFNDASLQESDPEISFKPIIFSKKQPKGKSLIKIGTKVGVQSDDSNFQKKKMKKKHHADHTSVEDDVNQSDLIVDNSTIATGYSVGEKISRSKKKSKYQSLAPVDPNDSTITTGSTDAENTPKKKKKNKHQMPISADDDVDQFDLDQNDSVADDSTITSGFNEAEKEQKKKKKGKRQRSSVDDNVDQNDLMPDSTITASITESEKALKKKKKNKRQTFTADDDDANEFDTDKTDLTEKLSSDTKHPKTKSKLKIKGRKENMNFISENGTRYKVFKDGQKKPWYDLPYEENEIMTRYNKFFVFRNAVEDLNKLKASMQDEGIDQKTIIKNVFHNERKAHNRLRVHLLKEQLKKEKHDRNSPGGEAIVRQPRPNKDKPIVELKFEENDMMTSYDGFWIMKSCVQELDTIHKRKVEHVIKSRENKDENPELTTEETQIVRREMKKEKRKQARYLKLELIKYKQEEYKQQEKLDSRSKSGKPGKYLGIDFKSNKDLVKFDGIFVKKEAAERLQILRDKLTSNDLPEEEVASILKNERRKEERAMKKENAQLCFRCRKPGHVISLCPESTHKESGMEVCFRCGSTEHMARDCTVTTKGSAFSHASCFYCGEGGHIARECPDNPKGLYPRGGACRECGSVEHLKKDCPDLQKQSEQSIIRLNMREPNDSIEGEEFQCDTAPQPNQAAPPKAIHVRFDDFQ